MNTPRHTWLATVVVAILLITAGCIGIPGGEEETNPTETEDPPPTVADEPESSQTEMSSRLQPRANAILLDLSDLGAEYDLNGERLLTLEDASTNEASELRNSDIVIQFERSFTQSASTDGQPSLVLSSVTVYEDNETAQEEFESITSAIDTQSSGEEITVLSDYSAQRYQFENDRAEQNTMIVRRAGPIVYYIVTSDTEAMYPAYTQELFRTMLRGELVDLEN